MTFLHTINEIYSKEVKRVPPVVDGVVGDGVVGSGVGPAHAKRADNRNTTREPCPHVGYLHSREPWLTYERTEKR